MKLFSKIKRYFSSWSCSYAEVERQTTWAPKTPIQDRPKWRGAGYKRQHVITGRRSQKWCHQNGVEPAPPGLVNSLRFPWFSMERPFPWVFLECVWNLGKSGGRYSIYVRDVRGIVAPSPAIYGVTMRSHWPPRLVPLPAVLPSPSLPKSLIIHNRGTNATPGSLDSKQND